MTSLALSFLLAIAGIQDAQTMASPYSRPPRALVVGIEDYQGSIAENGLGDLLHARDEALAIAGLLKGQGMEVTTLIDEQATQDAIQAQLYDICVTAEESQAVVIYLAGHGVELKHGSESWGYFAPTDGIADLAYTLISAEQIQEVFQKSPARHKLLVSNACFSGLFLRRGAAPPPQNIVDAVSRPAALVIAATGTNQEALDTRPDHPRGFAACMRRGISDSLADVQPDGYVTGSELFNYLNGCSWVGGISEAHAQSPAFSTLAGHEGGDIVFIAGKASLESYENPPAWLPQGASERRPVARSRPASAPLSNPADTPKRGGSAAPEPPTVAKTGSDLLPQPRCGEWKITGGKMPGEAEGWLPKDRFVLERMEQRYLLRRNGHALFWFEPRPGGVYTYEGSRAGGLFGILGWYLETAELGETRLRTTWMKRDGKGGTKEIVLEYLDELTRSATVLSHEEDPCSSTADWRPRTGDYRVEIGTFQPAKWNKKSTFTLRESGEALTLLSGSTIVCKLNRNPFGDFAFEGSARPGSFAKSDAHVARVELGKERLTIHLLDSGKPKWIKTLVAVPR